MGAEDLVSLAVIVVLPDGSCKCWRTEGAAHAMPHPFAETDRVGQALRMCGLTERAAAEALAAMRAGVGWQAGPGDAEPVSPVLRPWLVSLTPLHQVGGSRADVTDGQWWLVRLEQAERGMPAAALRSAGREGAIVEWTDDLHIVGVTGSEARADAMHEWFPAGAPLTQVLRPIAMQRLREIQAQAAAQGPGAVSAAAGLISRAGPQGSVRWLEVTGLQRIAVAGASADRPADPGWRAQFADVTAEVRMAQIRRIREQALHLTGSAVAIIDALDPLRPMIEVSPGFCAISGYAEQQLLGRSARFLTGLPGYQDGGTQLGTALQEVKARTARLLLHRPDGTRYWARFDLTPVVCEASGETAHMVCMLADISESRELIAQLAAQTAMLETVHHDNPNGLLAFDEDGVACLQNYAFKRLTGLYAVGMPRHKVMAGLAQAFGMRSEQLMAALEADGLVQCKAEAPGPRVIEVSSAHRDGVKQARLLILRDVTAEAQFNEMQLQFLSTAAHEIRTPMASIQGFSGLMLSGAAPPEMHLDLIRRIHRQSERLGQMINDLLDLSRIESRPPGTVDLESLVVGPVVAEVVDALDHERARVVLDGPMPDAVIRSNRGPLAQILMNLIGNALKYSTGQVKVSVRRSVASPGMLDLAIEDRGIGMSEDVRSQLFTKFFRADPDGPVRGTGLGLSIAKALADRIEAAISVWSEPGQGSVFTLHLPLALRQAVAPATAAEGARVSLLASSATARTPSGD